MRRFSQLTGQIRQIATMAGRVHRVTMFKLPKAEDQQVMIKEYEKLWASATKKDGKPYILAVTAGPAEHDERSLGYTFVSKSEFGSLEDMKFYDHECEAHMELKKVVKSLELNGPPFTIYFKPAVVKNA